MTKDIAVKRFGQLWDEYVDCPKSELTKDAIELRKQLKDLVGV